VGEALDELEKEEAEPKLKKKKAPLQMKSSMVEMTPAKAKMANEYVADEIEYRKEKKKIDVASIPTKKRNREETDVSKEKLEQAPARKQEKRKSQRGKRKRLLHRSSLQWWK
jgi:hypothetical protein